MDCKRWIALITAVCCVAGCSKKSPAVQAPSAAPAMPAEKPMTVSELDAALDAPGKSISKEPNPYPAWEYVVFQFQPTHRDEFTGQYVTLGLILEDAGKNDFGGQHDPISCNSLDMVLDWIGRDGWELAGINGDTYIVKRPIPADLSKASWWHHGKFYLDRMPAK